MKKILSLLLTLIFVLGMTACSNTNNNSSIPENITPVKCNVYGISGPTGIGLVNLMENSANGKTEIDYNIKLAADNQEIIAKVSNKEADIAAVATNVASTIYNKTNGEISVLAINTEGVLAVVSKGEEITDLKDLKGKTVYTTGQGANPEYIITHCLKENGLTVGSDVDLQFVAQPQELVAKITASEKAVVIAPQPVATMITVKDSAAKIVIDMNDEWNKVSDTGLVMGCIIANNDFIKANPDAVETFLKEYKASIEAVNDDIDSAAALCEKYGIVSPAPVAKKAIPYCHIVFQSGKELKTNLSAYLDFLFNSNPQAVGGKLPDDDFYYNAN